MLKTSQPAQNLYESIKVLSVYNLRIQILGGALQQDSLLPRGLSGIQQLNRECERIAEERAQMANSQLQHCDAGTEPTRKARF